MDKYYKLRIADLQSVRREVAVTGEGAEKKFSGLVIIVLFLQIFWFAPSLFALSLVSSVPHGSAVPLYAHFHQDQRLQPPDKPAEVSRLETVRLDVTGAMLARDADDCSHHRGCTLEIGYRLSSKMRHDVDVAAQVICQARLGYTTSHGYQLRSERCSAPADHVLHRRDQVESTLMVKFHFSPYEQVIDAQLGSIQCRIERAEILPDSSL